MCNLVTVSNKVLTVKNMQSGNLIETNGLSVLQKIKYLKDKLNISHVKHFLSTPPFPLYINALT